MSAERANFSLQQWLQWLEASHPVAIDLGLDRIRTVAAQLAIDLSESFVITIAGTNGKGSTQAYLDTILRANGATTACYSSPHFLQYNERIRVNGENASDAQICAAFCQIDAACQATATSLTYFEFGTLAALIICAQAKPDYVLLEVGLGGRLDATNLVDTQLAVVTTVAIDHVDWLGDDREKIGYEKAGIARAGRALVCGDLNPPSSIARVGQEVNAPVYQAGQQFSYAKDQAGWNWRGCSAEGGCLELTNLPLPVLPLQNAATALQVLHLLPEGISESAIRKGLEQAQMTGRMQQVQRAEQTLVLDVAHNPEAAEYLAAQVQARGWGQLPLVLGMLADKDIGAVVRALAPVISRWNLVGLDMPRGQSAQQLAALVREAAADADIHEYDSVASALADNTQAPRQLVAGSFFTVSQALEALAGGQTSDKG